MTTARSARASSRSSWSRDETAGIVMVEASHDGYVRRFGLDPPAPAHPRRRRARAARRGPAARCRAASRRAEPSPSRSASTSRRTSRSATTADGQGALLRVRGRDRWQFRCRGGRLADRGQPVDRRRRAGFASRRSWSSRGDSAAGGDSHRLALPPRQARRRANGVAMDQSDDQAGRCFRCRTRPASSSWRRALARHGVELVSTGGTARALREAGSRCSDVSDLTGFPEMMDGRVKTLHPMVHGGLLAVRDDPEHAAAMEEHGIGAIDLVVVNLYPFAQTVVRGAGRDEVIENIDIGGPSMVRSAAKNHRLRRDRHRSRPTILDSDRTLDDDGGTTSSSSASIWRPRPSPRPRPTIRRSPHGSPSPTRAGCSPTRCRSP